VKAQVYIHGLPTEMSFLPWKSMQGIKDPNVLKRVLSQVLGDIILKMSLKF
jgi:hypothetical protein